ncbi:MAG TPA: hypothetical protein VJQ54_25230 [Candidatus Sulfotelmatobacter sp.]|nr:hypothetical protein [Candidatus Sulfotelmatobacter sp.]
MFDRAADLGIDLILAGHTHGGQLGLEFVHRGLNLSHMFYRYTSGWYEQRSSIRLGARLEITILELVRA